MSVNFYDKTNNELKLISGGTLYADAPVGAIQAYGGTSTPSGWVSCDGTELVKTSYPELYAVIGDSFGTASDTDHFVLPTIFNHDILGEYENIRSQVGANLANAYTMPYDGYVTLSGSGWSQNYGSVYFIDGSSGTSMAFTFCGSYDSAAAGGGTAIFAKKGDKIYASANNGSRSIVIQARFCKNYCIIKAKHTPVPTDFTDSLIGYLGKETNYNLYPWSHERTVETPDDNQNITIERDGWYSIDYTLSSNTDTNHTFTLRDFDSLGEAHTIMRSVYDKSGTFRQTFLVPLKAGTYRYSHGGIGTLNVYMNRRDFA